MDSKLYLKYRPNQLDNIVGQRHVVKTLMQASKNNNFAHAYLFSGERGCGKTSMARILASLMNCEKVINGRTCQKCHACLTIPKGSSVDVKELDGATNRGIESIKDLIDSSHWYPQELPRKIFIIDECHQLSREAISALLKTLEEPPSYLTFILCTTDIKKILPTILSRCQRFNFNKIMSKDISLRLAEIADKEKINIETDAITLISRIARGSMRDAIGYLEQAGTVGADRKITSENLQKYFGSVDRIGIFNMIKAMKSGNIPMVMDQVNDMIMASASVEDIMFEISEAFRNIMLLKIYEGKKTDLVDLPDHEIDEFCKMGKTLSVGQLVKLAHLFAEIDKQVKFNINERWIMEATLIKCVASLRSNN